MTEDNLEQAMAVNAEARAAHEATVLDELQNEFVLIDGSSSKRDDALIECKSCSEYFSQKCVHNTSVQGMK